MEEYNVDEDENIICVICRVEDVKKSNEKKRITSRGADGINKANDKRNDNIKAHEGSFVHSSCQKKYTDEKEIQRFLKRKAEEEKDNRPVRKSQRKSFDNKDCCLFCDKYVDFESPKSGLEPDASKVRTDGKVSFATTIKNCCKNRQDELAFKVNGKIEFFQSDLHAADVVYHRTCSVNFRTGRQIPVQYSGKERKKSGRPENVIRRNAFLQTCDFFENSEEEQITLKDLFMKMNEYLIDTEDFAYDACFMKRKLEEHYGDEIFFSGGYGSPTIVTYRKTVNSILNEYHNKPKNVDINLQKIQLIETAAQLIKSEIKEISKSYKDYYPSLDDLDITNLFDFVPDSLKLLLGKIFVGSDREKLKMKISAIGQAIIQAGRPRSLNVPLQISLGITLHHHYKSKYMIDILHALGLSCSYKEVLNFERNAAMECDVDLSDYFNHNSILKFSADNADHNTCTLDGRDTFHGMGMIASISNGKFGSKPIQRRNVPNKEIISKSYVPIIPFYEKSYLLKGIKCLPLTRTASTIMHVDLLWTLSYHFKSPTAIWSGSMQLLYEKSNNKQYKKDEIVFLPLIDLDPSNLTCIFSTLSFLADIATKNKQPTIVAFDQPLYWKSYKIVSETDNLSVKEIVLMLGNFHTILNVLGCAGKLMDGSGLSSILSNIYAENAVVHMLSGKAYSRAVRGHLIVDQALSNLLFESFKEGSDEIETDIYEKLELLYTKVTTSSTSISDLESNPLLKTISEFISKAKNELELTSRTAKLWFQYQNIINVMKKLLTADRIGDWALHLEAIYDALPLFAAAGHINYTKSAYLYLQSMQNLKAKNNVVYNHFQNGCFVVRRSPRYWAGLPCDLIIEQVLMRSLKTTGGLTRGSGFSEITRSIWLLSNPVCSKYRIKFEENLNIEFSSSEQHKTCIKSRIERDHIDTVKVYEALQKCSPFNGSINLINIITGLAADDSVNVDRFTEIGQELVDNMEGHDIFTYECSRKAAATNMTAKISLDKEKDVKCDPALLFQRLLLAAQRKPIDISEVLSFELSPFPLSIFESSKFLRKANKPNIVEGIIKMISSSTASEKEDVLTNQYVLDGGSLLHRIHWTKGKTYGEIAELYSNFVISCYQRAIVVFDGYDTHPSTKDTTHLRRAAKRLPREVQFTEETIACLSKEDFLSHSQNKAKFIKMVGEKLENEGCQVIYSKGDADRDVALTSVQESLKQHVTVIGEDTDLLILLLYFSKNPSDYKLFFRSDRGKKESTIHDIYDYRAKLGDNICNSILFIHAFSGCDTTSQFSSIGKGTAFDLLVKNSNLSRLANIFMSFSSSQQEIENAGQEAACILYKAKTGESVNELRKRLFMKKVLHSKSFVKPEKLPPTEPSLKYHSYRVHHQILEWLGECSSPSEWGWFYFENTLLPRTTDGKPAPDELLKTLSCSCKGDCSTNKCGCRKGGYECSSVCGSCQSTGCSNVVNYMLEEEVTEMDEHL